jgi:hypothetical protein
MTLEIHVLASNKHNIVAGLNLFMWFKLSPLYNFISNGKAAMQKTAIKYPHIFCSTQNEQYNNKPMCYLTTSSTPYMTRVVYCDRTHTHIMLDSKHI